ncbi:lipopolysaccharide transport periplasmic protein LptA [Amphritea sp. 2_MG-2023]|uniref:lipopolysaccharide transport periplasmic protein LptA n=1 Tax=Amphritea TaxID=515417 RepID=UPI001C065845|nr:MULTISPECIES: lipopolysaccharide transport periplasmic protein LptA [Amphritea]MBU2966122.1 lipopolysaccharide transport periplasmic protein LptA [Amphritea atlantica]MDO6418223.1 lipopolysaccharide transport periplasmic protein LptA [Amphritea sp. 2_MG-2023]MDX2422745.1 lipopolysaccharide transport periplasmic protein LptA [Amphritea sp.]
MLINRISKALCVLLLSWQPVAMALPSDANKAIHISADSATRNDQTGITLYTGDVLLTQGSMKVSGDSIELRQANNSITKIIAKGRPAEFQQRPAADEEITHAYGKVLNYNVRTKELEIIGQAKVSQGADVFSGNRIVYNMNKSTVNAFRDESADGERVQIVIQPKPAPIKTTEVPVDSTTSNTATGELNNQ